MPKTSKSNPKKIEKAAELEAEALTNESDEATQAVQNLDEEAEKALVVEEATDTDAESPAEVLAMHEDNESAQALNEDAPKDVKKVEKAAKSSKKDAKKPTRSPKHLKASEQVEKGKQYTIDEAIELVKKTSYSKFDGSVELHLKLLKKKSKTGSESARGIFHLPHGTGKTKNIIVLDENKIEQIAKTKKIDFDIALASPDLMPKVAKIAKILGPKGKMPDPKSGTVTIDPKKTIDEINSGKIEYRIDAANNIHQIVGKVSWDAAKLSENLNAIFGGFQKSRIEAAYLTATMAPSITLDLTVLK